MQHPTKQEKSRIRKWVEYLKHELYLRHFVVHVRYMDGDGGNGQTAECNVLHEYQSVSINIYTNFWQHPLDEQFDMLVHEFCHVHVTPLQVLVDDAMSGKFVTPDQQRRAVESVTTMMETLATYKHIEMPK